MSNETKKYAGLEALQTFLDGCKTLFASIKHKHKLSDISDYTVDTELSSTSTNPVQNKVVNTGFSIVGNSINSLQTAINNKADSTHNHDDIYYTESEIDTKLSNKSDKTHNHDTVYDAKGSASDALTEAKEYTNTKTSNLASTSVVDTKISTHNTSTSAHNDIRDLIDGLTTRLNALADSDDTTLDQMSEIVAYIKSNKNLIDSVTTSKVNVSDIVDNLTTNVTNKPLSAAQGVAIKSLIDALQLAVDGKADEEHTHNYAGSSSIGGSANSAVKWETARNINGMSVDGSANRTNYGTCSTAAGTAAKTVACTGFSLVTGAEITVKFTVSNAAASPTLNVNSTGAKPIFYRGAAIDKSYLVANRTYTFRYDGTNWDFVGDINVDTNTDTKVTQTNTTSSGDYRVLFSGTADDTSRDESARKSSGLTYNPSTGTLTATAFKGTLDGSVDTATKLSTARAIDGVNFDGSANITHYGECTTSNYSAAKTVSITGFTLVTGAKVCVKFKNTNSQPNPTLNVNSTGAKSIMYRGANISTSQLAAGRIYEFVYDGTNWELVGDVDTAGTTASQLTNTRTIDGVKFDGTADITHYGTCSNTARTAAKTVSLTGFSLATGAVVRVKFTVTNTASNPTLNVNGTGAKNIRYNGANITASYLAANKVYEFVYDGSYWNLVGDIDTTGSGSSGSTVSFTQKLTSGTEIGTITINGTGTKLYAPAASSGGTTSGNYLPLTGGNITGNVTFNNAVKIIGKAKNGTGYEMLRMGGTSTEPAVNLGDGLLTSKVGIVNVGANRIRMNIPDGSIVLRKTEGSTPTVCFCPETDNSIVLGHSSYKWKSVYATNGTIQTSDAREKENILPLGTVMAETCSEDLPPVDVHEALFDKLKPVQYNFINDPSRIHYGLIAQDVAASMEELGIGENDLDLVHHDYFTDEKTGEEKDAYGLTYTNLIPMLIHEVQKLKSRVDELECQLKDK